MIQSDKMEKSVKFVLPAPIFEKNAPPKSQPHYLTPSGMTLLTREKQPPPMYGPKGSTVPPKYLQKNEETKPPEEPPKRPYCEACEMELQSVEDFRRHRAQHERCPVDGCKFKGHPNVMDKHVTALHASGIFDKIKKLSTPEEIAAWREERRRKYPTLANAKMRQLAKEQRERRGERLEENKARFGRHEDRKRARANDNKGDSVKIEQPKRMRNHESNHKKGKDERTNGMNYKKKVERNIQVEKSEVPNKVVSESTDDTIVFGIKMFRGTSELEDYKHEKSEREKSKNVLSSLLGMYGSSDDEDDDSENDNTPSQDDKSTKIVSENSIKEINENSTPSEQETLKDKFCDEASKTETLNEETASVSEEQQSKKHIEIEQKTLEEITEVLNEESSKNPREQQLTIHEEIAENNSPIEEESLKNEPYGVKSPNKETTNSADNETNANKSNESSDEEPTEMPIQRFTTMPVIDSSTTTEGTKNNNVESIEEKRLRIEQSRKKLLKTRTNNLNIRRRKLRKQNTMLEKLLEPEIRHERNVLLQCVRFVCENNFFGIGAEQASNNENVETETTSTV